ncbi:MAG: 30S ribosomal protein S20 [Opitutaceae bacterium]
MANTKSAIKNIRKNDTNRLRNKARKSRIKTLSRRVSASIAQGDAEATKAVVREYISALDTAAKVGVIHKNAAGRLKSKYSQILFS